MPSVCHQCSGPLRNEHEVCPFCGAQIVDETANPTIQVNVTSNVPKVLIVVAALVLVLVGAITVFVLRRAELNSSISSVDAEMQFIGHAKSVTSLAFSANGDTMISASEDATIRVWDVASGQCLHLLAGHEDLVTSVRFSRDGRRAVSTSWDQTVRLWDTVAGSETKKIGDTTRTSNTKFTLAAAFVADDRQILIADAGSQLVLFDPAAERELRRLRGHTSAVNSVAISADSLHAASGSSDNTVRVWHLATGDSLHRFAGHTDVVNSVAFSPDGRRVISGANDHTVRLWDARTGQSISQFDGHTDAVLAVAFLPDGAKALSGSADKTVRLWDITRGVELHRFEGHSGAVTSISVSPDGKTFVSGSVDKTIHLWSLPE
jgi:WD40 repeat protein